MNNLNKYLPLGSVVMLKGAVKRLMIIGFCSYSTDDIGGNLYDYIGCLYPEGMISNEKTALFNHEDISKIYYIGYTDKEEKEFKNNLQKLLDETQKESEN